MDNGHTGIPVYASLFSKGKSWTASVGAVSVAVCLPYGHEVSCVSVGTWRGELAENGFFGV